MASIGHRIAVLLTLLLVVGAGGLLVMRTAYSGKVLPSIYVADVPVGGLTQADALAAVDARASTLLNEPFVFNYEGRQWTTNLAALGVESDPQESVDLAFTIGREPDARERVGSAFSLTRDDEVIPLALTIDRDQVDAWIEQVTNDIDFKPRSARIVVTDGRVSIRDDVDGIVVDEDRILALIQNSITSLTAYKGPLPVVNRGAPIHTSDLGADAAMLTTALSKPITIVYKSKEWTLEPADLGQFVKQVRRADDSGYAITLDDTALGQWVHELIGDRINREPVNALIEWDFDKDKVVAYEDSSIGVRLLATPTADDIIASFFGNHENVNVTVKGIKPEIDSDHLDDLNITTRLSQGVSAFYGSNDERAANIWVGTNNLNGAIVRPGEEFSFNDSIGDITAEAGYVEAPVVDGERIGKDVGGGICQVSTTMFRAAFFAGFPITEWWPHLYRLGFYEADGWEPGLDASILQSGSREFWGDFRFLNTTDGYLLIEAYVIEQQDFVVIYGPNTKWNVQVSGPTIGEPILGDDMEDIEVVDPELDPGTIQQTELRQDGLDVTWRRTVTDENGVVISDRDFPSLFAARGDVWTVSPDMEGESPAVLDPHIVPGKEEDEGEESA